MVKMAEKIQSSKSLKRTAAMIDDEEISLMENYKRWKKKKSFIFLHDISLIRRKTTGKEPRSLIRSLESIYEQDEDEEKKEKKKKKRKMTKKKMKMKKKKKITESISTKEKEDKGKKDLPVFELPSQYFFGNAVESDEEVLGDDERGENFRGHKYLINENKLTYTRVKVPKQIYFRRASVLYCEDYPVPTLAKFALDRYNSIEGTNYKYVGLVKAYAVPVGAYNHTVRFQACLPDQDPIYFQAIIYEPFANTANEVLVEVILVHPLP